MSQVPAPRHGNNKVNERILRFGQPSLGLHFHVLFVLPGMSELEGCPRLRTGGARHFWKNKNLCDCRSCNLSNSGVLATRTHNFFTCRISTHGRCHGLLCLNEFRGVVLTSVMLSRQFVERACYSYHRKTRSHHGSKHLFIQGHESGNLSMQTCCGVIWWLSLVVFCAAHEYRPSFLFFTLSQKQSSLPVACTRQLGCLPATLDRYTNTHDSLEQCLYSGLWRSGMIPLCRAGRVSTGLSSPSSPDSLFCPPASSTPAPN